MNPNPTPQYALSWISPRTELPVVGPVLFRRNHGDLRCGHTDEPMTHEEVIVECKFMNDADWTGNINHVVVEVEIEEEDESLTRLMT